MIASQDPMLSLLLAAVTLLVVARLLNALRMTFRGRFGRNYQEVVDELFRETERRGALLEEFAALRDGRIERAEKRLEPMR